MVGEKAVPTAVLMAEKTAVRWAQRWAVCSVVRLGARTVARSVPSSAARSAVATDATMVACLADVTAVWSVPMSVDPWERQMAAHSAAWMVGWTVAALATPTAGCWAAQMAASKGENSVVQ